MRKEQVADAADERLRRARRLQQVDVAEHRRQRRDQHHRRRDPEQVALERLDPAHGVDQRRKEPGNAQRFGPDDAVDGELDDLRGDHLRQRHKERAQDGQQVVPLAAPQEEEDQLHTAHLPVLSCLHNSSIRCFFYTDTGPLYRMALRLSTGDVTKW